MRDDTPAFEPLSRLFHGNREQMRRALNVFHRVTAEDLAQLDAAFSDNDWAEIARVLHKTKSACLQIGESEAAEAAVAAERALLDVNVRAPAYRMAREELGRVQERVTQYLTAEDRRGEGECGS
jgi:HPt (histidine-containing phosphotransfer) domain-containing protein